MSIVAGQHVCLQRIGAPTEDQRIESSLEEVGALHLPWSVVAQVGYHYALCGLRGRRWKPDVYLEKALTKCLWQPHRLVVVRRVVLTLT